MEGYATGELVILACALVLGAFQIWALIDAMFIHDFPSESQRTKWIPSSV